MSLLVHELLIGTGGGGSGVSNLQASPSNPVPIAAVTVTHSNSTVQVAHLQNRVVTITSNQARYCETYTDLIKKLIKSNYEIIQLILELGLKEQQQQT